MVIAAVERVSALTLVAVDVAPPMIEKGLALKRMVLVARVMALLGP